MSLKPNRKLIDRKQITALLILLLLIMQVSLWNAAAQDGTEQPVPEPTITVSSVSPTQVAARQQSTITVTGENFTNQSQVTLNGTPLNTQVNSATTLSATIPSSITPGQYGVQVTDPVRQVNNGNFNVNVVAQQEPAITVTGFSPLQVYTGRSNVLTVDGTNFTANTRVEVVGEPDAQTIYVNEQSLQVALPSDIPVGTYVVRVTDPVRGSTIAPGTLTVLTPPAPPATQEPQPTSPPPTPIPGQPSLIGRNFLANPSTIQPGGSTTLTFELVNQGNRTAQGVSVTLDPSGSFFPANGQASVLLPDILPGGIATVTFGVTAGSSVQAGPASVPFTVNYRDFEGTAANNTVTLTVNIGEASPEISLVTLSRYMVQPNPVQPGQPVILSLLFTNSGNSTASQVVVRVATGEGGVLLAGPQGDAFPVGDIAPGQSVGVEMPLVVAPSAKAGPQAQTININYISGGEAKEGSSSITLDVAAAQINAPVLLLDSYDTGKDVLHPGDTFTLTLNLKNVGTAPAGDLLITFGTVESSGGNNDSGSGGSGSSSSTIPSSTFAPLGSGGTLFAGTLAADGESLSVAQEFIVSGSVSSGIYSLPITLRYTKADGTTAQETLRASLVVLVPPQMQINVQSPLPEEIFMGDTLLLGIQLVNVGSKTIEFRSMTVETDNGEVIEGANVPLAALPADEELIISGVIIPAELGTAKVTVTLHFINELNQPDTFVLEYETTVVEPPEMPTDEGSMEPPIIETPMPTEAPSSDDVLGRLLLGLLGLGS